ncbi:hypothetical protein ACTWQB_16915, partial [Piscibacillus sp. B03]|uniref:hypothetical protein n=1 Tax=Piscibacillus sp. B03 TaxID=3457430 RepID=UPI003FCDCAB9
MQIMDNFVVADLFGMGEKMIDMLESMIKWMFDALLMPFQAVLPQITDLIFGEGDNGGLIHNTFTEEEWNGAIMTGMKGFYVVAGVFLLIAVVIAGKRIS